MTDLKDWTPRPAPDGRPLDGRFVRLERLDPARHGSDLGAALSGPAVAPLYDYLFEPPPAAPAEVQAWLEKVAPSADPFFYAAVPADTGRPAGRLALMRIDRNHGVIEVGNILYAPAMQRTPATTETIFLLARHVFEDLGYRRFEWKCNNRNEPSKRSAERFGFRYEGLFRQHMVTKGRSRDTAWFAMTDADWPGLKRAYERWLAPENFDASGRQRTPLGTLTAATIPAGAGTLRRATLADQSALETLQHAAFTPNTVIAGRPSAILGWDHGTVLRDWEVWLLDGPDGPVGAVTLSGDSDAMVIESVAVAPAAQGRGHGRLLLAAAERRAAALGCAALRLRANEKLPRNTGWYARQGFAVEHVDRADGRSSVHFVKALVPEAA